MDKQFKLKPIKPLDKDNDVLVKEPSKEYNKEVQNVVVIRNLLNAIVKVTGAVTGKQYIFAGAGTTQNVDIKDAYEILNKKRGKSCCGTATDRILFELA